MRQGHEGARPEASAGRLLTRRAAVATLALLALGGCAAKVNATETSDDAALDDATSDDDFQAVCGYSEQEIWCSRDGLAIYGVALVPDEDASTFPTVIISHGFSGSYEDSLVYGRRLARNGIAAYCYDFCGGSTDSKSDGDTRDMSVVTEEKDLLAVVSQIRDESFVDASRLFLMGESQGGFVSGLVAAQIPDEVRGLVLLYPAIDIVNQAHALFATKEGITETELWGMDLGTCYYADVWDIDPYAELVKYTGDVIISGRRTPWSTSPSPESSSRATPRRRSSRSTTPTTASGVTTREAWPTRPWSSSRHIRREAMTWKRKRQA